MSASYPAVKKLGQNLPDIQPQTLLPSTSASNVRGDTPSLLAIRMDTLTLQGGRLHSYGLE